MALKFVALAVVCFAQGFALGPPSLLRGEKCKLPSMEVPHQFDETMHEMDEVRETVSMAAVDAYVTKRVDILVVLACFQQERENYIELGQRISQKIEDASQEISENLRDTAEEYVERIEVPVRAIAATIRELPEVVYNYISNKEFVKALEAVREARRVVEENSRILGNVAQELLREVPELADRVEELARDIRKEARTGISAINKSFKKCIEQGGPEKE